MGTRLLAHLDRTPPLPPLPPGTSLPLVQVLGAAKDVVKVVFEQYCDVMRGFSAQPRRARCSSVVMTHWRMC